MRETKIIAAGANPAVLGYVSGICLHKGALEGVSRMWQQQGDSNTISQTLLKGRMSTSELAGQMDMGREAGPPPGSPSGAARRERPVLSSSRETPEQGNASVPPSHIPGGNRSGQGTELTSQWGVGVLFSPLYFLIHDINSGLFVRQSGPET